MDSGASICLGGLRHLSMMGLEIKNLVPCKQVVTAVGNHKMICRGWLPIEFSVNHKKTNQALPNQNCHSIVIWPSVPSAPHVSFRLLVVVLGNSPKGADNQWYHMV